MLEISKPIIKKEDRISPKFGEKTTFLNSGVKYSDICNVEDKQIRKPVINVKKVGKPTKKIK